MAPFLEKLRTGFVTLFPIISGNGESLAHNYLLDESGYERQPGIPVNVPGIEKKVSKSPDSLSMKTSRLSAPFFT